jgi:hypothetical protein
MTRGIRELCEHFEIATVPNGCKSGQGGLTDVDIQETGHKLLIAADEQCRQRLSLIDRDTNNKLAHALGTMRKAMDEIRDAVSRGV